jgi:hypothetical protein
MGFYVEQQDMAEERSAKTAPPSRRSQVEEQIDRQCELLTELTMVAGKLCARLERVMTVSKQCEAQRPPINIDAFCPLAGAMATNNERLHVIGIALQQALDRLEV